MQMKMVKPGKKNEADNKDLFNIISQENEYIVNLLELCNVPENLDDEREFSTYLTNSKNSQKLPLPLPLKKAQVILTTDETEQEKKTIENKLLARRGGKGKDKLKKKKDKMKKQIKTQILTAAKSAKNEKVKEEKLMDENLVKPVVPEFNKEAKLVFSKIDFPTVGSKFNKPKKTKKKNKLDKIEKNPLKLIANLKKQKDEINELVAAGEDEKATEIKQQIAWKKVFDKTEGKKIKDNPTLIMKGLTKRRKEKKKSKVNWKDREEKVAKEKDSKQKKRQANINKKIDEKKKFRAKLKRKIKGKVV